MRRLVGVAAPVGGLTLPKLTGVDLVSPQQRGETAELIEPILRERGSGEIALVVFGPFGEDLPDRLAAAPILTDFVAHGVMAVWTSVAESQALVSAA